jgi:hypothetical protein
MANKKTLLQQGQRVEKQYTYLAFLSSLYQTRRKNTMYDATDSQAIRAKAALELLKLKAVRQMCEGKATCTLDESDIQEVLFVAGMKLKEEKELEVM